MCYNNSTIDVSGRDPWPAGTREPKGQNSQVKEPGTDVSLESDITPKKQGCRYTGLRRLNLSGTMTGLAGKTQNAWCCEPFFGFGDRQKTALRKKEGT